MTDLPKIEKPSVRSISAETVSQAAAPAAAVTLVPTDPSPKSEEVHARRGGPRTAEGKARAKHNATKHGLFADIVLTGYPFGESLGDYTRLLEGFREDIQPVGAREDVLVEQLAFEFLRLGRLYKADVQVAPQVFRRLEEDLKRGDWCVHDSSVREGESMAIRRGLASELLLRYGNSVSNQIHRILDRLERLQKTRRGQPVAPRIEVNVS
jgi:hypothetical protein